MANKKTEFLDAQGNPVSSPPVVQQSGPLSGASTVMLDSAQHAPRQQVTPTMMKERPRDNLPPMRRPQKESTMGRWIAGPIIAGQQFGWLPCLLWIMVGVVFIGAVHDMSTLVASVRHDAKSIAEVVREAYPDHTAFDRSHHGYDEDSKRDDPTWYMVDLRAVEPFARPVTLPEIKTRRELAGMVLLRIGRLSVTPVTAQEWETIRSMGV